MKRLANVNKHEMPHRVTVKRRTANISGLPINLTHRNDFQECLTCSLALKLIYVLLITVWKTDISRLQYHNCINATSYSPYVPQGSNRQFGRRIKKFYQKSLLKGFCLRHPFNFGHVHVRAESLVPDLNRVCMHLKHNDFQHTEEKRKEWERKTILLQGRQKRQQLQRR